MNARNLTPAQPTPQQHNHPDIHNLWSKKNETAIANDAKIAKNQAKILQNVHKREAESGHATKDWKGKSGDHHRAGLQHSSKSHKNSINTLNNVATAMEIESAVITKEKEQLDQLNAYYSAKSAELLSKRAQGEISEEDYLRAKQQLDANVAAAMQQVKAESESAQSGLSQAVKQEYSKEEPTSLSGDEIGRRALGIIESNVPTLAGTGVNLANIGAQTGVAAFNAAGNVGIAGITGITDILKTGIAGTSAAGAQIVTAGTSLGKDMIKSGESLMKDLAKRGIFDDLKNDTDKNVSNSNKKDKSEDDLTKSKSEKDEKNTDKKSINNSEERQHKGDPGSKDSSREGAKKHHQDKHSDSKLNSDTKPRHDAKIDHDSRSKRTNNIEDKVAPTNTSSTAGDPKSDKDLIEAAKSSVYENIHATNKFYTSNLETLLRNEVFNTSQLPKVGVVLDDGHRAEATLIGANGISQQTYSSITNHPVSNHDVITRLSSDTGATVLDPQVGKAYSDQGSPVSQGGGNATINPVPNPHLIPFVNEGVGNSDNSSKIRNISTDINLHKEVDQIIGERVQAVALPLDGFFKTLPELRNKSEFFKNSDDLVVKQAVDILTIFKAFADKNYWHKFALLTCKDKKANYVFSVFASSQGLGWVPPDIKLPPDVLLLDELVSPDEEIFTDLYLEVDPLFKLQAFAASKSPSNPFRTAPESMYETIMTKSDDDGVNDVNNYKALKELRQFAPLLRERKDFLVRGSSRFLTFPQLIKYRRPLYPRDTWILEGKIEVDPVKKYTALYHFLANDYHTTKKVEDKEYLLNQVNKANMVLDYLN